MLHVAAKRCPELYWLALWACEDTVTSIRLDDGTVVIVRRRRGLVQGAKQSAPLANLLTAVVLEGVEADLKAGALRRKLPEPAPTLMGYADNAFGSCHRDLAAYAFNRLAIRAAQYGFEFDDRKVHFHGSIIERDAADAVVVGLAAEPVGDAPGVVVGDYVHRPDRSGDRLDLATCLGVPVPAGKEEDDALTAWLSFKADAIIGHSNTIIELRDACLEEDALSLLAVKPKGNPPSMIAFEALGYFRRCWDHILRNVPRNAGLNPHITRIDTALDADLIKADRYGSTVPLERILPILHRNGQNGGANIRTLNDAADPALLASLSNIFESVAVRAQIKTEDYNDSELGRQLRNALSRVGAAALAAEQRFEDAKGKPRTSLHS